MPDTAALQLLAYAMLTFMGVCIASAALLFSYRQNYGWSPVILVTSHGLGGMGGEEEYIAHLDFEFWNRRKYPVVIRIAEVDFGEVRLQEKSKASGEKLTWDIFRGTAILRSGARIDPASHHLFECRGAFRKRTLDDLDVMATVTVHFFDPLSNRTMKKVIRHQYTFKPT